MNSMSSSEISHPYEALTPDAVLDAVEQTGVVTDGRLLSLNSYENRVYQVGIEDSEPLIAKFYRPGRWQDEAILEEHQFAQELVSHEIPVVAPLANEQGDTLRHFQGFRFALFPRRGGHWPELEDPEVRLRLGRFLGRIHAVGECARFQHRATISIEQLGIRPRQYLLDHEFLPTDYKQQYSDLTQQLLEQINERFEQAGDIKHIRLHGDCHPGNILWRESGAHFVDLDDCVMGPAIQDLWMLLSGDRAQMNEQFADLMEGYNEFHDFDFRELRLIESLRTLRIIHYASWLARRWNDPAFPHNFPWFNTVSYWEEHILTLREQTERLLQPPLGPDY